MMLRTRSASILVGIAILLTIAIQLVAPLRTPATSSISSTLCALIARSRG